MKLITSGEPREELWEDVQKATAHLRLHIDQQFFWIKNGGSLYFALWHGQAKPNYGKGRKPLLCLFLKRNGEWSECCQWFEDIDTPGVKVQPVLDYRIVATFKQ